LNRQIFLILFANLCVSFAPSALVNEIKTVSQTKRPPRNSGRAFGLTFLVAPLLKRGGFAILRAWATVVA
jgi:hypothetical protein